jgi:ABC-type polysaccharide/polyol phosphate transport system ATPase subunit
MAYMKLDNIHVHFSIYQAAARSWRRTLFRAAVGGMVNAAPESGRIVVRALEGINLELKNGCRLAVLGHNGAGKTTLLRTLAGIYHPTRGSLIADGRRAPLFDIALGCDEEATGLENIMLRGLLMGLKRAEIESKMKDISDFSGLGEFIDLPVRTYSTGMSLRLMFAIATNIEADILLMDEWIATGDQDFADKANRRLSTLIDRSHILVIASHDLELLEKLCNRGIVLNGGRLVFDGTTQEAIDYYRRGTTAPVAGASQSLAVS